MPRPLALLLLAALPAPALAQAFPPHCIVTRECQGQTCTEAPGVTLAFETTAAGLVAWEVEAPEERIPLTALPGEGPAAWAGRVPDLNASILLTRIGPERALISMHSDLGGQGVLTSYLTCVSVQPPRPAPGTPPLSKRAPA